MPNKDGIHDSFQIFYKQEGESHFLIFRPTEEADSYPEKIVPVTEAQWDLLRFHFVRAVDDKTGDTKLVYIK